jgi:exopolysaccharide biosynthesis predicted pyruvyltransferase EpsI
MTTIHAPTPSRARHDPVVARLGALVRATLSEELAGVRRVALLDFPNHPNIGDSAIWLGERAALRSLGVEVAYACDQRSYVPAQLRAALGPEDAILLHGGGNLGDLYPRFQRLRERVLADFPDRLTIQLPVTVTRMSAATERRMRELAGRHRRLRVLARDEPARRWFAERLGIAARLCPDPAFCLGPQPRGDRDGVLWLARSDDESLGAASEPPDGVRAGDWPAPSFAWHRRRMLSRRASFAISALPWASGRLWRPATALYGRLAAERVGTGLRLLGGARAVVTDRLHAHILSLLCGVPHVLRDNSTGKVRGCVDAWTGDSPLVHWSDDDGDALELALELAAGVPR